MDITEQSRLAASLALSVKKPATPPHKDRLQKTAQEFEAIFVQQMFKEMRRTIPTGGLLPRGNAEEIFTSLQDQEAARQLTTHGGIGLARIVAEQMRKDLPK